MSAIQLDVVVLTKNSVRPCLRGCLGSIFENIPVSRLIVVDGGSEDETLSVIRHKTPRNIQLSVYSDKGGSRASSRQIGINRVKTEWFMFVDSDVVVSNGWYEKAEKLITPEVGAIWGLNRDYPDYNVDEKMQAFKIRGGCHDILIRTKAIKSIRIPRDLHFFEDWYIKTRLEKQGWKVIATEDPYCDHFHFPKVTVKRLYTEMSLAHKYGIQQLYSPMFYLRNFIYRLFGWGALVHPIGFHVWRSELKYFFSGTLASVIAHLQRSIQK